MLRLALRNLFQNRARLVVSVGGVALALMLILSLDAIVAGIERQVTAYIEHSGADVWVSQENVRNLHMASSALPASVASRVKAVDGVAAVTAIYYRAGFLEMGNENSAAYVIGLPDGPLAGGPWQVVAGSEAPGKKGVIVDRGVAARAGANLGGIVKIAGEEFTIRGFSEGTASATGGSVAFVSKKDWESLRGDSGTISFVLVRVADGETARHVAARIEATLNKVTAQTRQEFSDQERQVVRDMSTDIVAIMNLVGFMIGSALMALTVYTATLARRAEYGVLKALGARTTHLVQVVLAQALVSVALALAAGLAFTLLLAALLPRLGLALALDVGGGAVLKAAAVSLLIAGLSAILPVQQIAGLDPARVFRGK